MNQPMSQGDGGLRFITWWRCGGCVAVLLVLGLGSFLGIVSVISSWFEEMPLEVGATDPGAVDLADIQERARLAFGSVDGLRLTAPELTAWVSLLLAENPDVAGPGSVFGCSFEAPGELRIWLAMGVPELEFPASMVTGRFFNIDLTASGQFHRAHAEALKVHRYRMGPAEEITDPEPGTEAGLGAAALRLLEHHPRLAEIVDRLESAQIEEDSIVLMLQ